MKSPRMYPILISIVLLSTMLVPVMGITNRTTNKASNERVNLLETAGSISEPFVENKGQWDERILFSARTDFGHIALGPDCIYYNLIDRDFKTFDGLGDRGRNEWGGLGIDRETITGTVIKIDLVGSNEVLPTGEEQCETYYNFFLGSDQTKWVSEAGSYRRVEYSNVWDGISMIFTSGKSGIKYDIQVEPHADPSSIVFKVEGHTGLFVKNGDLIIDTPVGNPIIDSGLMANYMDGQHESVQTEFNILDGDSYTILLNDRDVKRGVLIDPLVYSTYVGGNDYDHFFDIDIDENGNSYMTGYTYSTNFPVLPGCYQTTNGGIIDVMVSKLDSTATSLLYSTYIGGSDLEYGLGIKIDESGNAFVTGGVYSIDFPVTKGAFNETHWNSTWYLDVFVLKLDSRGSSLTYSTYVAGEGDDIGWDIDIDSSGNAYVVGETVSLEFPTTSGAYQDNLAYYADMFFLELNPTGSSLLYSTYIGGDDYDSARSIFRDRNDDIYIAGSTWSWDFPTTSGAYQTQLNGGYDVVALKLDIDSSSLLYSTYVGGDDFDEGLSMTIDTTGNAYITGYTDGGSRTPFPTTKGAYDTSHNGASDAFILKLDPKGSTLLYSTYIGGGESDQGMDIEIDKEGQAYICGYTYSNDYPSTPNGDYPVHQGGEEDGFVTLLDSTGTFLPYSTFLGGSSEDEPYALKIDDIKEAYVTGGTYSKNFPTTQGVLSTSISGSYDCFVTKMNFTSPPTAPRDLSANAGDGFIELTWTEPLSDGGSPIIRYSVYRKPQGGDYDSPQNITELAFNDTEVVIGQEYHYRVSATNIIGEGLLSDEVFAVSTSVPDPPENVMVTAGVNKVDLDWDQPSFDGGLPLRRYRIYKGIVSGELDLLREVAIVETSYTDTEVVKGGNYYYQITAVNDNGESLPCNETPALVPDVPSVPWNLSVITGDGYVELTWEAPEMDGGLPVTRYMIYRGEDPETVSLLKSVTPDTTVYNDTQVTNGDPYYYKITAENNAGESDPSEPILGIPMTTSSAPLLFEPEAKDGSITLTWRVPDFDGGSDLISFRLYVGNSSDDKELLIELDPEVFEYEHTDLTNGETYFYHLTALNSRGESIPSNEVNAVPLGLPDPPTDLSASSGDGFVSLSWNAPMDNGGRPVDNFNVFRGTSGGSLYLLTTTTDLFINDTEIENGVSYYYQVSAVTAVGESARTLEVVAEPLGFPGAPVNMVITPGDGSVELSWGNPTDDGGTPVTGFKIYRGEDVVHYDLLKEVNAGVLTYPDTNVTNGVTYHYWISAVNLVGESSMSMILTATPLGMPTSPKDVAAIEEEGSIVISWGMPDDDGGSAVTKFIILRSSAEGDFQVIGSVSGTQTRYTDMNVLQGVEYSYKIKAETEAGQGEGSSSVILKLKEPSEGSNLGLIIAIVIILIVLLIIVLLIVLFFIRNKRKKAQLQEQQAMIQPMSPGLQPGVPQQGLPPQQYQQIQGYTPQQQTGLPPAYPEQQAYHQQPQDQYYGEVYQGSVEQQAVYQEQAQYGYPEQQYTEPVPQQPADQYSQQPSEPIPDAGALQPETSITQQPVETAPTMPPPPDIPAPLDAPPKLPDTPEGQ